ncbi:hypothetical protein MAR_009403 [Mya arenaria]|uniref:Uncharacterized protein n=1 Tax=Mya arenaria TaxID=6604 RepID=A0ABY7E1L1_MYAAR|nr:hypothetical protein MAR_009403 [Mya arenaria]
MALIQLKIGESVYGYYGTYTTEDRGECFVVIMELIKLKIGESAYETQRWFYQCIQYKCHPMAAADMKTERMRNRTLLNKVSVKLHAISLVLPLTSEEKASVTKCLHDGRLLEMTQAHIDVLKSKCSKTFSGAFGKEKIASRLMHFAIVPLIAHFEDSIMK